MGDQRASSWAQAEDAHHPSSHHDDDNDYDYDHQGAPTHPAPAPDRGLRKHTMGRILNILV